MAEGAVLIADDLVAMLDAGGLDVVVWERGVGLTLACGTGACAAVVASALADESPFVRREALQAFVAVPAHTSEELAAIDARRDDPDSAVRAWFEIARRDIRSRN